MEPTRDYFTGQYANLPQHTRASLTGYLQTGQAVGHFLTAVLANNLQGAFSHADNENSQTLKLLIQWVYNQAPAGCWGNREQLNTWMGHQGLSGLGRPKKVPDQGRLVWVVTRSQETDYRLVRVHAGASDSQIIGAVEKHLYGHTDPLESKTTEPQTQIEGVTAQDISMYPDGEHDLRLETAP